MCFGLEAGTFLYTFTLHRLVNVEVSEIKELTGKLVGGTVAILALLVTVWYISQVALSELFPERITRVLITLLLVGISFGTVYVCHWFLNRLEDKDSLTPHQKEISYRFIQISVYVGLCILLISYVWEINLGNILIGAGVLGVIIGFAAQKILSSVFSGIIIMSTDIYRVGDWVEFSDKFGRIQSITFFNTKIQSPQGEKHIIPNDRITSNDITNISQSRYRKDLMIGIDYSSDIEEAIDVCDDILDSLEKEPESKVISYKPTSVREFGNSEITLVVKVWIKHPSPTTINQVQTEVYSAIHTRFRQEGITIPFPQRTVSERDDGK